MFSTHKGAEAQQRTEIMRDEKGYEQYVSEAVSRARTMMEEKIEAGRASALATFEYIHDHVPDDFIVRGNKLEFSPGTEVVQVGFSQGGTERQMILHRNAVSQIAERADLPAGYIQDLVFSPVDWKRELGARTLNDFYHEHQKERNPAGQRYLLRAINGELRGVLSDRYRRLDSAPLVQAFADACQTIGAVPVEGVVTDTRFVIKAFLPMVFEPVKNEVMCLGVEWSNSDFGNGKHALRSYIFRLACYNGATTEDVMAQMHMGSQLPDNIEFSKRTYEADTRTQVSALRDMVTKTLAPKRVNGLLETIRRADEKGIEWKQVGANLTKKLLKNELQAVRDAYESPDVINLPPSRSVWRVSNAISWFAKTVKSADRKLELERLAGEMLGKVEDAA